RHLSHLRLFVSLPSAPQCVQKKRRRETAIRLRKMVRFSNSLIGVLNVITLVLSIPIIGGGIWLSQRANTDCEKFLERPLVASVSSSSLSPSPASSAPAAATPASSGCTWSSCSSSSSSSSASPSSPSSSPTRAPERSSPDAGSRSTAWGTTPTGSRGGWRRPVTGGGSAAACSRARCARACRTRTRLGTNSSKITSPLYSLDAANLPVHVTSPT
ncbi:unnamed protein product, partial [Musa acuminata subsp. burmannicoides]